MLLLHNESYSALKINIQVQFMIAFVTKVCNKKSEKSLSLERLASFGMGNATNHTMPWSWCLNWTTTPSTAIKIRRKLQSFSHLTDQICIYGVYPLKQDSKRNTVKRASIQNPYIRRASAFIGFLTVGTSMLKNLFLQLPLPSQRSSRSLTPGESPKR